MGNRLHNFIFDTRGSMSVEFAIWVPFMVFILVIVADTSFMFLGQNQMWAAARDAARRMISAGDTPQYVETLTRDRLRKDGLDYQVDATNDPNSSYVSVVITVPVSGIMPFGLFHRALLGENVVARVVMRKY